MNREGIFLTKAHRGADSTLFTGRLEGKAVRKELMLDEKDSINTKFRVFIPEGTTSFNTSFFLGLFFASIQKLGSMSAFYDKYDISLSKLEDELKPSIERNLKECFRKAENELNNSTGLD